MAEGEGGRKKSEGTTTLEDLVMPRLNAKERVRSL